MDKIFKPLFSLLRNHKLKMLGVLAFAMIFVVVLFPNDDLSDWLTQQIARSSGVYVQLDNLAFDLLPSPGLGVSSLVVDAKGLPTIKAQEVHVSALLSKLLTFKLGIAVAAEKLFRGRLNMSYSQGEKASAGANFDDISLDAEKISLEDLCEFLRKANLFTLRVQGSANVVANLHVDRSMSAQPLASSSFDISGLTLPSQSVMVDFNGVQVPQVIPTLELGRVVLKGAKLNEGVLEISELTIGDAKSEVSGKIKGSMGLNLRKSPAAAQPELKAIDLAMDLNLSPSFIDRNQKTMIGGFLILIPSNLKTISPSGTRLAFHLKLARPGDIPNFTPLTEKL